MGICFAVTISLCGEMAIVFAAIANVQVNLSGATQMTIDSSMLAMSMNVEHVRRETVTQYRQGDVLLVRVQEMPANANVMPSRHGFVILAEGEQTGHAHYVRGLDAVMLEANEDMRRFAAENGVREGQAVLGGLCVTTDQTILWHGTPTAAPMGPRDADHAAITLLRGDYLIVCPREYDDSEEFRRVAD